MTHAILPGCCHHFVGAGGIGFLILTAMNLFQYRQVATLLILTYILVMSAERFAAIIR